MNGMNVALTARPVKEFFGKTPQESGCAGEKISALTGEIRLEARYGVAWPRSTRGSDPGAVQLTACFASFAVADR
jgi:hypothetical protein